MVISMAVKMVNNGPQFVFFFHCNLISRHVNFFLLIVQNLAVASVMAVDGSGGRIISTMLLKLITELFNTNAYANITVNAAHIT